MVKILSHDLLTEEEIQHFRELQEKARHFQEAIKLKHKQRITQIAGRKRSIGASSIGD